MQNPLSNINPLSELLASERITEANINTLADKITADILENGQGVNELVLMNALKLLCEGVDARLRKKVDTSYAYDSFKGVSISRSNTGEKLNYDEDAVYLEIKEELKKRGETLKNAHKNQNNEITDKSSGEIIPIVSIKSPNKSIIKLSFPKI